MKKDWDDPWYHEPATENQLIFLNRLNIRYGPDISKGKASDLITICLEHRKLRNKHSLLIGMLLILIGLIIFVLISQSK